MKNKSFDTYYYKVKRGTATFVVGAGTLLAAQFVQAASADDVIPKWIVTADAPLPASGASAAMQPAQDGTASTGVESGTTTAADDAASVFLLNTCIGNAGNCAPNGGRGSGAGASAGAAAAGSSGSSASGGAASGGGGFGAAAGPSGNSSGG
ncbi:hypothetical protein VOI32_40915, partial [Paraburkholderia caribensis]